MGRTLIKDATLINEGNILTASVLIEDEVIAGIYTSDIPTADTVIDAHGSYLLPGAIDDHVHFRDPGLTVVCAALRARDRYSTRHGKSFSLSENV